MPSNGKFVTCNAWAPKKMDHPHTVSRALCLCLPEEECLTCENSRFVLRIEMGLGDQPVYCPRWSNGEIFPDSYVLIRRETCIRKTLTLDFCAQCPNANLNEPPRNVEGWVKDWEKEKVAMKQRVKALMEEMDEQERSRPRRAKHKRAPPDTQ